MWRWMALPSGPAALASGVAGLEKAVMEKVTVASWCWLKMKASSPRSGVARQCSVGEAASARLVDHIDDAAWRADPDRALAQAEHQHAARFGCW